jgi:hypothetical protein
LAVEILAHSHQVTIEHNLQGTPATEIAVEFSGPGIRFDFRWEEGSEEFVDPENVADMFQVVAKSC